jgi:hypothetical protein
LVRSSASPGKRSPRLMPGPLETATDLVLPNDHFDLSIRRRRNGCGLGPRPTCRNMYALFGTRAGQGWVAAILNFGREFRRDFFNPVGLRGMGRRFLQKLLFGCCFGP